MLRFLTFISILALTNLAVLADGIAALRQNCVACHGAITDGRKVVKGIFDITPLLKDGIQGRHTHDWVAVVEKLREKEMPPSTASTNSPTSSGRQPSARFLPNRIRARFKSDC